MSGHPIIFSAPMIRALLEGRKTQDRRILKPQPFPADYHNGDVSCDRVVFDDVHGNSAGFSAGAVGGGATVLESIRIPYAPGDRLWVRENFAIVPASAYRCSEGVQQTTNPDDADYAAIYAAGWERSKPTWKPSIHMKRWASRLTLVVTDVRVQRLQDISEADAIAEGGPPSHPSIDRGSREFGFADFPRSWFAQLWDAIHGPGAWDANPWVVAVSFDVHKCNIDKMAA